MALFLEILQRYGPGHLLDLGTGHDLIFDLGGTLSNPAEGFVRSINYALRQHGLAERDEEDLKLLIGPRWTRRFEHALYDGIPDALSRFKARRMSLGACTSKRTDFAELILEKFRIRNAFEFARGADIGIQKRQQLADLLSEGLVSTRSIMIGDRAVRHHSRPRQ